MTPETVAQAAQAPIQDVANASLGALVVCVCGKTYRKRRRTQAHCTTPCRNRQWRLAHPRVAQGLLDFAPKPEPLRPIDAPPPGEAPRLVKACAAILERLRQGPATGWELIQAGGGTRYSARILELRDSHNIEGHKIEGGRGAWLYTLIPGPK